MATYQDYIYGDRGFEPELIHSEGIKSVDITITFANGTSFLSSRFYFNEQGLCIKYETIGTWIGYPAGGPFSERPMQQFTLLSYNEDDGKPALEEVYDFATGELLGETVFSYRNELLEKSIRNRSFQTKDSRDVMETRYEYDSMGALQSIDIYSYKKSRSQSRTQFVSRGDKVIRKIVSTHMESEYNNVEELIEDTTYFYNNSNQLTEAMIKLNTGDESIDTFTYETPTTRNIKQQQRITNGITEFRNKYFYLRNGLISEMIKEFENQKIKTEYTYKGGK